MGRACGLASSRVGWGWFGSTRTGDPPWLAGWGGAAACVWRDAADAVRSMCRASAPSPPRVAAPCLPLPPSDPDPAVLYCPSAAMSVRPLPLVYLLFSPVFTRSRSRVGGYPSRDRATAKQSITGVGWRHGLHESRIDSPCHAPQRTQRTVSSEATHTEVVAGEWLRLPRFLFLSHLAALHVLSM